MSRARYDIKKRYLQWFKLITLSGVMSLSVINQSLATTGAEFLRQDSSPSAKVLMGGSALAQGSALLVVNPAGLLGEDVAQLSFTHFASFVETAYEQLEILYPLNQKLSLGGRVFYASAYNLMEIDEFGENAGAISNYDVIVHPAVAWRVSDQLNLGLGTKLFQSVLAGFTSQGAAVDLGAHYQLDVLPITLAAVLQNLGFMTAYDQQADRLPMTWTAGAAYKWSAKAHHIQLLADVGAVLEDNYVLTPVVGIQYHYHHTAFIRAAYRFDDELGNMMIGAGMSWQSLGVDYSYQPYGELGDNHRLTLSYYFKNNISSAPLVK